MGYIVIDCDVIAAGIHADNDCKKKLIEYFGEQISLNGSIDKTELSKRAFSSPEKLEALTNITHPFIIKKILSIIDSAFKNGEKIVFVDGAVIIGYSFEKYCDKIIVVVSPKEEQYKRLMARDNITLQQAENRICKQTKVSEMLKKADFIVNNNSTEESLSKQAIDIVNQLTNI